MTDDEEEDRCWVDDDNDDDDDDDFDLCGEDSAQYDSDDWRMQIVMSCHPTTHLLIHANSAAVK